MSEYAVARYHILERSRMFASLDTSGSSSTGEKEINSVEYSALLDESDDDDDDAFISFTTTESRCEMLYQRGLELKIQDDLGDALLCFEDCLRGMQNCQYFAKLPQTLQQLQHLYKLLGNEEKAEEYGEAEKLFLEATEPKVSSTTLKSGSQSRTKRKPFSKKTPSSLSVSSSNPAEYGNLMTSRAEEYERLASLSAEKGKMDIALDYCRKVVILRQCVYGQNAAVTEAAMTLFEYIYAELEESKGRLSQNGSVLLVGNKAMNKPTDMYTTKGDLSVSSVELFSPLENKGQDKGEVNSFDRKLQSANCGQPHPNMWSTGVDTSTQWQLQVNAELLKSDTTSTPLHPGFKSAQDAGECYTEGSEKHSTGAINYIPPILFDTTAHSGECNDHHILEYCGGQEALPPQENSPGLCWVVPVQPQNGSHPQHSHHHHHKNLCKGVTKNLTKLSAEFKAPMCVTLDVQTVKPGTGMEHPRCLPLWVLLLGAFVEMALLAYMLYNH